MRARSKKAVLLFGVTAGLLLLGWSAGADETREVSGALVSGAIAGETVAVRINGAPPQLADGWSNAVDPNDVVVDVAADGTFEIPLSIDGPAFYRLTIDETTVEIFLEPGDHSHVGYTAGAEPAVEFSGDRAELNEILRTVNGLVVASRSHIRKHAVEIFSSEPDAFATRFETLRAELFAELESLLAGVADVPPAFAARVHDDVEYWFRLLEVSYPSVHHEMTGERLDVPDSYLEELSRGRLDRAESMTSRLYVAFLNEYVGISSMRDRWTLSRNLPREKLVSRYEAIAALETSPEIENYLLGEMFRNFRISYGPRDWGRALIALEKDDPDNPVAAAVRPLYEQDMARREEPDEIRVFKEVDGVSLEAHIFYPADLEPGDLGQGDLEPGDRPSAYLFFHGGGWAIGTPEWGYAACERMAARGMVAITFEYRLADVHGTGLFASVEDVQSAVRWARQQANEGGLPIDPDRVVAAGFSAGGHLAGGAAILDIIGPEEPSPRPNALVIHSSSYNLTKGRFFEAMTGGRAEEVSLTHQVESGLVPAILFHGRYDHLAPLSEFEEFVDRMEELDNDFEYHLFEVGHFFRDDEARKQVHDLTDTFLVRRGFIDQ